MIVLVGGTGRTTISPNLAAMRVMVGCDALLIDTDTQDKAA
ncbi:MAG: hypothetical protein WAW61_17675 [Methylococcaceae bacterium]